MWLADVIEYLEKCDQDYVAKVGMGEPMSWRGDYSQVSFEPAESITVAEMLANAKSALGATFTGYKGGEYTMDGYSECYLDRYGNSDGNAIGRVLLDYMTGKV